MLREIRKTETKQLRAYLDSRNTDISSDVLLKVNEIIRDVKENGDDALRRYTKDFDGVELSSFRVSQKDIDNAAFQCTEEFAYAPQQSQLPHHGCRRRVN